MRTTVLGRAVLMLAIASCTSSVKTASTPHSSDDAGSMVSTSNDAIPGVSPQDTTGSVASDASDAAHPDPGRETTDGGTPDLSHPAPDVGLTDAGTGDAPQPQLDGAPPDGGAPDLPRPELDSGVPDASLPDATNGGVDALGDGPAHVPAPATGYIEIKLYDGDPPNFLRNAPAEQVSGNGSITNVSVPTLRRYPVDESKSTGASFVVFPGGAYTGLDFETHATALAKRLGPLGFAVFGLKYRVGGGSSNAERDALLDANRAIRLVRSHAAEWGLAENRVGVISYSAGSDLDMRLVAGGSDPGKPMATDPVDRKSSRPDFVASMCTWAHGGTTSPYKFPADTPPVYLCHAQDDTIAPIAVANQIDQQLQALHLLEHLEVYPTGGHSAFHVGDPNAPGRNWPDKFLPWLRANNLVP
jgi:acetyl esterase/lipase